MSEINYTTLAEALGEVPDPRNKRGRSFSWQFILLVIAAAMLTGEKGLKGISQWVREQSQELRTALKPAKNRIPSQSTIRRALCTVSAEKLEEALKKYQRGLEKESGGAGTIVTKQGEVLRGQALDGKTVRGASAHGELVHLTSLVSHESGLVFDQIETKVKMHERRSAETLLGRASLAGTVTTMDALHTSAKQARQIRQGGGDYLFVVKRNQRTLYEDIEAAFTALPPTGTCEVEFWNYENVTVKRRGHGRTDTYLVESTTVLNDYLTFPDVAQVIRRTRRSLNHSTEKMSVSVEYLITSLGRERVALEQVEQFRLWHWTIENVVHYPRDASFGEDRCQVRSGNAPQALAALRNAIASLLRIEGWTSLPDGFRYCRSSLQIVLQLLGASAT